MVRRVLSIAKVLLLVPLLAAAAVPAGPTLTRVTQRLRRPFNHDLLRAFTTEVMPAFYGAK